MINLAKSSKNMPQARTEDLSITVSDSETLVYDAARFVIHRLSAEVATIWRLADGSRDVAALAADASLELGSRVSARSVESILEDLSSMGLLQDTFTAGSRISRRLFTAGAAGFSAASIFISASAQNSGGGDFVGGDDVPGGLDDPDADPQEPLLMGDLSTEENIKVNPDETIPEDTEPANGEIGDSGSEPGDDDPESDDEGFDGEIPEDGDGN